MASRNNCFVLFFQRTLLKCNKWHINAVLFTMEALWCSSLRSNPLHWKKVLRSILFQQTSQKHCGVSNHYFALSLHWGCTGIGCQCSLKAPGVNKIVVVVGGNFIWGGGKQYHPPSVSRLASGRGWCTYPIYAVLLLGSWRQWLSHSALNELSSLLLGG